MGTRHLVAVMIDGEYKVAQYGQWDGYPSGHGVTALEFLRDMDRDAFANKARACHWANEKEIDSTWEEFGVTGRPGMVPYEVAKARGKRYPHLDRDAGAEILSLVSQSENGLPLNNSIGFANDSLFCEYAYVVDLDKDTFEVFRGFNKEPVDAGERFYNGGHFDGEYYPVRFVRAWSLCDLPSNEAFVSELEQEDEG